MSKKISVFITSYNQKKYLIEAIESVLNQSLLPFEIIIVDDCSSDGSRNIIEEYANKYRGLIRAFYNKQNLGIPQTKSFGFRQVRGDLVTLLDGDDRFLPTKLEKEFEIFINHPEVRIVFSNVFFIDEHGNRTGIWCSENQTLPPSCYIFHEVFAQKSPFWSFRNELIDYQSLKKIGFYDSNFSIYEDWDLKIRQTKSFKVTYCPEPLSEYRQHSGGIHYLPASLHLSCVRRIYRKNYIMLNHLSQTERAKIEKSLFKKMSLLANKAAYEEIEKGNKKAALHYWMESLRFNHRYLDLKLIFRVLIPRSFYLPLKELYRSFCEKIRKKAGIVQEFENNSH